MVKQVASAQEFKDIVSSNKVVVVDFFATWCGPCKMIAPKFEELSKEYTGKAAFVKVDVDELEDVAAEYNVEAMPTFAVIKDGKIFGELVIGANIDNIKKAVAAAF